MATTALVSTGTVLGQANDTTPAEEPIEEVVVRGVAPTYRPKEQTSATGLAMDLIDTPQSVSIITQDMLRVAGADSLYEATDFVPGLERGGSGYGLDRYTMRGIATGSFRINGLSFSTAGSPEAYLMERLEIVRGPATALYGVTGSFGGEFNHVLKRPLNTFRSEIGLRVGDFDLTEVEFDITGPISGTGGRLSARLVGTYSDYGLPVDVVNVQNEKHAILGSLQFDFTDSTTGSISVYNTKLNEDPYDGGAMLQVAPGVLAIPDVPTENWYYSDPRYSRNDDDNMFAVAELQHFLANEWEFTVRGAVNKGDYAIGIYFPFGPAGAYDLAEDEFYFYTYDQFGESESLTWQVSLGGEFGAFEREHQLFASVEYSTDGTPYESVLMNSIYLGIINIQDGGRGIFADGSPIPLVDRSTLTPRNHTLSGWDDLRASVQLLVNPIDRLSVLAGILWQNTKGKGTTLIQGSVVLPEPVVGRTEYTESVMRLGATWDLLSDRGAVDDARLYASYSEGFNPNLGIRDEEGNLLDTPQLMKQYEIGLKTEFLGGAFGTTLALYDSDLRNVPVSVNFLGEFGNPGGVTLQGKQDIRGIEFDAVGELLPGLNVAFNYAYTDTEISDPNYDFTIPVKTQPKHQGALFASYEFLEGRMRGFRFGGGLVAKGDYSFAESLENVERFGEYIGGGHTRIDLNASFTVQSGWADGFQIYANAHNITDEVVFVLKEDHPGFGLTHENPRAYSIGIRYVFGGR